MQLRQIEYFVRLAESRHFGRVAEQVGLSTSDISQQVRKLEDELGLKLFARTSRSVEITPVGADLLPLATSILANVEAFRHLARTRSGGLQQKFRICYFPESGRLVSAVARSLSAAEPGLTFALEMCRSSEVIERVAIDPHSIGIVRSIPHRLNRLTLASYPYCFLAVPLGHELENKKPVTLKDLSGQPLIYTTKDFQSTFRDKMIEFFDAHQITPKFMSYDCSNFMATLDFVASGQVLALIPETVAIGQPRNDVAYCRVEGPVPSDDIELVWSGSGAGILKEKFLDAMRSKKELGGTLAQFAV